MSLRRALLSPYACVAIGGASVYLLLKSLQYFSDVRDPPVIESPLRSLIPSLTKEQVDRLPYPPDAIPGRRDVPTPYGSMRVYEWGPEDGRKVLFVHGISTPCISCKGVAQELVERAGCRVMIFDLFGRGYSDCPTQIRHDFSLYTSQILLALSSSSLPWTGAGNEFTIVGYSFGGGIACSFASVFPYLISSVIAIAPSGLLREDRISWKSRVLYGTDGILPETLIRWLVERRLGKGQKVVSNVKSRKKRKAVRQLAGQRVREKDGMIEDDAEEDGAAADTPGDESSIFVSNAKPILGDKYPDSTETIVTQWQLDNHQGYVPAFISCIRHAPIYEQYQNFRRLRGQLDTWNAAHGQKKKKVLLVLGETDPVVLQSETIPDWQDLLGQANLELLTLDAGHDVPVAKATDIASRIQRFWRETGWENHGTAL